MTTDPPFTDADIGRCAEAMYEHEERSTPGGWYQPWTETADSTREAFESRAKAVLKVLARTGRLLPGPLETREKWRTVVTGQGLTNAYHATSRKEAFGSIRHIGPRSTAHVERQEIRHYPGGSFWTSEWAAVAAAEDTDG